MMSLSDDKQADIIDAFYTTSNREGSPYLACNDRKAFFLQKILKQ